MYLKYQIIITTLVLFSDSARILMINPFPSYSHQIVSRPIALKLAQKGHQVVYVGTLPTNSSGNLKAIDLSFSYGLFKESISEPKNSFMYIFQLFLDVLHVHDVLLQHPEMKKLIVNQNETFDLVINEFLLPTMFAFKKRFNCPFIGIASLDVLNQAHALVGNAINPTIYPDSYLYRRNEDDFLGRLSRLLASLFSQWFTYYYILPKSNEVVRKHFGSDIGDVGEIEKDVDMLFVVSNKVLNIARPVTRSTIFIDGGIHINEQQDLPKDLKKYMDASKRGVIYISFGSNVHTALIPQRSQQILLNAFEDLPYDFLWKFEEQLMLNVPTNVKLMKWVPQQDLLRHKNVKLFITHGGLQSTEEALLFKVPMITIPFFADQSYNGYQIERKGIGIMFENVESLTSEQLKSSILEVINNQTYRDNLNMLSNIMRDEPMTPVEKAVWWTEYVLRHKGAKHLRGPIVPFYQYYLLDIFAFILLVASILIYITNKIVTHLTVIVSKTLKNGSKEKQM